MERGRDSWRPIKSLLAVLAATNSSCQCQCSWPTEVSMEVLMTVLVSRSLTAVALRSRTKYPRLDGRSNIVSNNANELNGEPIRANNKGMNER